MYFIGLFVYRFILSLCFLVFVFSLNAKETNLQSIPCSPELKKQLEKILKVPEARTLIASIQQQGSFRIVANHHKLSKQFGAYWDLDRRQVCINCASHVSEGRVIGSILFELHNALITAKYDHLDHLAATGQIDKESYVRSSEYLEYQNSLMAAQIAKKGIEMGIFPKDACLPTYSDFEEHYHFQKVGGHSAWIAKNFDNLIR